MSDLSIETRIEMHIQNVQRYDTFDEEQINRASADFVKLLIKAMADESDVERRALLERIRKCIRRYKLPPESRVPLFRQLLGYQKCLTQELES